MSFIQKTQQIRQEGKLHWWLVLRIRILLALSLVMAGFFAFTILYDRLYPLVGLALAAVGFALGYVVFSRMAPLRVDATTGKIRLAADVGAYVFFVLYLGFEVTLRVFFTSLYEQAATVFILAVSFGVMCGRTAALALAINKTYPDTHP